MVSLLLQIIVSSNNIMYEQSVYAMWL